MKPLTYVHQIYRLKNRMSISQGVNRLILCTIVVVGCWLPLSWVVPASAEKIEPPAAPATLGDPRELETFVDSVINGQMEELHIAGAVVVIVQDGEVLLSKGYGYANIERGIPIDPERTLFKPGSVSKLFTWTAVMQLVEQGKLNLQADVNTYLTDFKIPATFLQPITMLDLMAHTAGFDVSQNQVASTLEALTSLEDYLRQNMPERIYPPGEFFAYSNYSAALAGYIVEQVSGEPYAQYIAGHILKPLGMDHSTMEQPLPEAFAPDMSQGYSFNGSYIPYETFYILPSPAGALSASGIDMGKFMLAHLQDGEMNGVRILKSETAREMHSQSYSVDPAIPGIAHGFYESTINSRRVLSHGGDYPPFDTLLALIPEERTGLYVGYNSETAFEAREPLLKAFMDRYYPGTPLSAPQATADFASRVKRYTGEYVGHPSDADSGDYWKAFALLMRVQRGPNNTLLIDWASNTVKDTYIEVQPFVLQNTRTGDLAVFDKDERGQVRYLAVSQSMIGRSLMKLVKVPWYGGTTVKFGVFGFSLLIFVATLVAAPVALLVRRRKQDADRRLTRPERLARWVALAFCVVGIGFLALGPMTEMTGLDTSMAIAVLAWSVAVLAMAVVLLAATAWWKGWWGLPGRLHYTVIALVGVVLVWYEIYWEFLKMS
jgi:CubicO group peptidase (beta-lactamase class C family)